MSKIYQKIELTAGILIIAVVLLIGCVLIQKKFFSNSSTALIASTDKSETETWAGKLPPEKEQEVVNKL